MSCGVGCRCGLDPELLWLWCRLAAVALIRPIAWEPPCATGVVLKRQKTKKKKIVKPLLFGFPPALETPHPPFFLPVVQIQVLILTPFSFYSPFPDDLTSATIYIRTFFPSSRPYISNGLLYFVLSMLKTLLFPISIKVTINHLVLSKPEI